MIERQYLANDGHSAGTSEATTATASAFTTGTLVSCTLLLLVVVVVTIEEMTLEEIHRTCTCVWVQRCYTGICLWTQRLSRPRRKSLHD